MKTFILGNAMLGSEKRHNFFGLDSKSTFIDKFCDDWRETIHERDRVILIGDTGPKVHRYLYKDLPGRKIIIGKPNHATLDPIWHDHMRGIELPWTYNDKTVTFHLGTAKGDVRLHTETTEDSFMHTQDTSDAINIDIAVWGGRLLTVETLGVYHRNLIQGEI